MRLEERAVNPAYFGAVIGDYVLGDQARRPGVNVFACRVRSISPRSFVVSAPVIGQVGDAITASFPQFGTVQGHIDHHVSDGFAVNIEAPDEQDLAATIDALQHRLWSGEADRRGEQRFMPGEPRSVIVLPDGAVLPCLVVEYSASGAAVSADINPAIGARLTIGEVAGQVVRRFNVGFTVSFDLLQDPDEIEQLLEAPEEWRDAVSVLKSNPIDTNDLGEVLELTDYAD
ncbi:MAG: hypothetical protein ABI414_15580 [Devosia sp.]